MTIEIVMEVVSMIGLVDNLTCVHKSIVDLVQEFEPEDLDYIEMNGQQIVAALATGEDVRITFNLQQVSGDAGAADVAHLVAETIRSLGLAWTTYRMYKSIRNHLVPPAPPPSSLLEAFVQELVAGGYALEEAQRIAVRMASVIRKHAGE